MLLTKLQTITTVFLIIVLVAGGAGVLRSQPVPQLPAAAGQPKDGKQETVRTDLYGDPLPAGAVARLGTVRFRHGGFGAHGLTFLPDGKTLVAANEEGSIWFWEATTGKLLRTFDTRPLTIRAFALSPDGKQIAVAGFLPVEGNRPMTGVVRLLEASSGKEVRTLPRDFGDVGHGTLAFTPDGRLLVSIGENGILRIAELASGVVILQQRFPGDILANLALSPDGSVLAVASGPNTRKLYLWKWQAGEEPRELQVNDFVARWLAFSPNSKILAAASDSESTIRLWDVESGRPLSKLKPPGTDNIWLGWLGDLVFSADGRVLASAGRHHNERGMIHFWEPVSGRYLGQLEADIDLSRPAISADSRLIAAGAGSGVRVWDLASRKELASHQETHSASVGRVAVSARDLVATASDDHTVRLWDARTGRQRFKLTHGRSVRAVALSPDGGMLASSSMDDTVRLWDVATGHEIYTLAGHGKYGGRRVLGFTPDGKQLLSWGDDFYLRLWDVRTGKALLEQAIRPSGVKVPDEDRDGAGAAQREKLSLLFGEGTFSSDGQALVLSIGSDFHVFEVATGKELRKIPGDGGHVVSLAISPDGKRLLASAWSRPVMTKLADGRTHSSAANDHPISLWNLATGERIQQILLPEGGVGPVTFSPDGKVFAAGTDKPHGKIRLWEVATGKEQMTIEGFRGAARSLAFSPDGKRLISGMQDTTALVWDLSQHR